MTAPASLEPSIEEAIAAALGHGGFIEITTTGRRSGLARRIPIVFHVIGGRFYISGMPSHRRRAWLANLESEPRFTVHLVRGVGADLPATARPIKAEGERRAVLAHVARAWGRDDVEVMVRFSPLVEFTVGPPPAA